MIIRNKFNGYSVDGRRLYPGGSGGGGGQPTNTTQTTTTIPEYARPTTERMIGRAEALSRTPYQAYKGERIAEFTPLQQQSFAQAGQLGRAPQLETASDIAGIAGLQGIGAGQQYAGQATSAAQMGRYMSPYTQLALEPQLREAARRSAMEGQMNQAQAVQRGAFGGARTAIMEAERQRNLGQLQSDIYGRGMQTAFEQARQAQQFGADLGLRGAGLAGQTAATLGQLGQTQFGQDAAAIQAKAAAGAQQQQLGQQKLTQAYQDFLSQRGYEREQLSFLSDILRGVPMSQTSYQMYQAPASFASQAAQLGLGAYGFSQLGQSNLFKKEGGVVKGYAGGGIAMAAGGMYSEPPEKLMGRMEKMSDEQLQTIGGSTDNSVTLGIVNAELERREAMRNSQILAQSIPEDTVQDAMMGIDEVPLDPRMFADTAVGETAPSMEEAIQLPQKEMARGGIVAFAKGAQVQAQPDAVTLLRDLDPSKAFATPEQRIAASEETLQRYKTYMGPDEVEAATKELGQSLEVTPENRAMQRAGIAFALASKFGRRGKTFEEEAGEASGVLAEKAGEVEKLDREIKRQQKLLNLDLKKVQRAEKSQRFDIAERAGEKADDRAGRLYGLQADRNKAVADLEVKREQIQATERVGMAQVAASRAAANKPTDFRTAQAVFMGEAMARFRAKNPGREPTELELATMNKQATVEAANAMKQYAGDIRGKDLERKIYSDAREQALKERDSVSNKEFRRIAKEKGISVAEAQELWIKEKTAEILAGMGGTGGGGAGAGGAGAATVQSALPMPANKAGLEKGLIYNTARGPARWNGTAFEAV